MHRHTDYPKNANRKTQKLKSLNGLPHGHGPRCARILCLRHFYQNTTNLRIEDRLKTRLALQRLGNRTTLRRERTKQN